LRVVLRGGREVSDLRRLGSGAKCATQSRTGVAARACARELRCKAGMLVSDIGHPLRAFLARAAARQRLLQRPERRTRATPA